jgi:F5/8 type C domain/Alpha-L-fucosidase
MKIFEAPNPMTKLSRKFLIFCLVILLSLVGNGQITAAKHPADWLHRAKWGVMAHYIPAPTLSAADWNQQVNSFDVQGLARQLKTVGAKYFLMVIGQNSGHYCAPNAKYDAFTKISPSKCSKRDLVSDIYKAINPLGIKLMIYLPAGSPFKDPASVQKLGGIGDPGFQKKWDAVIREWSLRWGKKVTGWWFDGVVPSYYSNPLPPNFSSFVAAAKAGNPDSIVAFNSGPKYPPTRMTDREDYTAGEVYDLREMYCSGRWVQTSQFHLTSFLGTDWGVGPKRYSNQQVQEITRQVNRCGGAITWDVPIQLNGKIPQPFIDQLMSLKSGSGGQPPRVAKPMGNLASFKPAQILNLAGERNLPINSAKRFPGQGVDGDLTTYAQASDEYPWTYQVDLLKVYSIKRLGITFGSSYATEYKIIYSIDGHRWYGLTHEKNARGEKRSYQVAPTKMRYIRVQGIKPDSPNQPGGSMSIVELEAYQ